MCGLGTGGHFHLKLFINQVVNADLWIFVDYFGYQVQDTKTKRVLPESRCARIKGSVPIGYSQPRDARRHGQRCKKWMPFAGTRTAKVTLLHILMKIVFTSIIIFHRRSR